jgi:hypothetical protein
MSPIAVNGTLGVPSGQRVALGSAGLGGGLPGGVLVPLLSLLVYATAITRRASRCARARCVGPRAGAPVWDLLAISTQPFEVQRNSVQFAEPLEIDAF